MQSVQKKRSLPPDERTAFWKELVVGRKACSQRFVALSDEFFLLVRYIRRVEGSFHASLRNVLGTRFLQGGNWSGQPEPR